MSNDGIDHNGREIEENRTFLTQCNKNSGLKSSRKREILNKYPVIVSCLVMGSRNLTSSSYAVRSIPCSSKRWGRSSYKKSTNWSTSTVDFGGFWSTKLNRTTHLEFRVWGLEGTVLLRVISLPELGGRKPKPSDGVESAREFWRENRRAAIWATTRELPLGRWDYLEVEDEWGQWMASLWWEFCGAESAKSY